MSFFIRVFCVPHFKNKIKKRLHKMFAHFKTVQIFSFYLTICKCLSPNMWPHHNYQKNERNYKSHLLTPQLGVLIKRNTIRTCVKKILHWFPKEPLIPSNFFPFPLIFSNQANSAVHEFQCLTCDLTIKWPPHRQSLA